MTTERRHAIMDELRGLVETVRNSEQTVEHCNSIITTLLYELPDTIGMDWRPRVVEIAEEILRRHNRNPGEQTSETVQQWTRKGREPIGWRPEG